MSKNPKLSLLAAIIVFAFILLPYAHIVSSNKTSPSSMKANAHLKENYRHNSHENSHKESEKRQSNTPTHLRNFFISVQCVNTPQSLKITAIGKTLFQKKTQDKGQKDFNGYFKLPLTGNTLRILQIEIMADWGENSARDALRIRIEPEELDELESKKKLLWAEGFLDETIIFTWQNLPKNSP